MADLQRIQSELQGLPGMLSSGIDVVANAVDVEVEVATAARQRQLDDLYGGGTVRLNGFLRPA
jgi:hypothetical protein